MNGAGTSGSFDLNVTKSSGACAVTVSRAGDSTYFLTFAIVTPSASKGTQAPIVVSSPTSGAYGQTAVPIVASGGSGTGVLSYAVTGTACSRNADLVSIDFFKPATPSTDPLNPFGTCSVTVTRAADSNYNVASSSATKVTVTRTAQQPIVVTSPLFGATLLNADQALATSGTGPLHITYSGGSGTGAITYSVNPTSTACQMNSSDLTGQSIYMTADTGTCIVKVSKAGDADFEPYVGSNSILVGIPLQPLDQRPIIITGPLTANFGSAVTPTLDPLNSGSGIGALSYTTIGDACVPGTGAQAGKIVITHGTGICQIVAHKEGSAPVYNPAQSAPFTITVQRIAQTTITASASLDGTFANPAKGAYGDMLIPVISGGNGLGAVWFSATGTACTNGIVGARLLITAGTGTCYLTAHRNGDLDYLDAVSTAVSLKISKAVQGDLWVTGPASANFGPEFLPTVPTADGGSGAGAIYFTATGTGCSIALDGTLSVDHGNGTCFLTAHKAADSDYLAAASPAYEVFLIPGVQTRLSITGPLSGVNGGKYLPTATGGSSGIAPTFTVTGTACTMGTTGADAGLLLVTAATGTCALTAHMAGDIDFAPVDSAPMTVNLAAAGRASAAATTVVATDAGNGSVNVTWNAPTVTTGITHYIATAWSARTGGTAVATCQTVGIANRACTIAGLTMGTTFYISVVTYVGASASPATARVAVTPVGPPAAPTAVTVANVTGTPTSLRVTWTAANNRGSAITGSVATAWSAATGGTAVGSCTAARTAVTCTITGLARTTTYYVSVVSTNAIGAGPASARVTKATV